MTTKNEQAYLSLIRLGGNVTSNVHGVAAKDWDAHDSTVTEFSDFLIKEVKVPDVGTVTLFLDNAECARRIAAKNQATGTILVRLTLEEKAALEKARKANAPSVVA